MSYMRDSTGRRLDAFKALGARDLRRAGMPGIGGRPKFSTAAPTVGTPITTSSGTPTTGSTITNPVKVSCETPGAFTYLGGTPQVSVVGGGAARAYVAGAFTNSTGSPWACEFLLDSVNGAFEVIYTGNVAGGINVVVDGVNVSTTRPTFRAATSDGSTYIAPISGLGAGRRHIRLEIERSATFHGIIVGNTDGVRAVLPPALKMAVVGDSFTEPTTVDSNGVWQGGWVQMLGPLLGVDAISCGSGGTGYLNPGTGGRVKFRDRLTDYVSLNPDIIVWAGGINDHNNYTAAAIGAEAAACFAAVKAALPNCLQVVLSPFYPRGNVTFPLTVLPCRDAIKAAALAAGCQYVELLELPPPGALLPSGTVQAASIAGATTISSNVSFPAGAYVRIGTGATQEVRAVASVSGTGPYTLNVQQNGVSLAAAHTVGDPIVQSGPSYVTGTGKQGTPTGNGTAERYTGSDSTHPTVEGHLNIALAMLPQMQAAITA
jgi:hypothetical protein